MNKKIAANTALIISAAIWGATFVFQRTSMEVIGPFTMGSLRFFVGSIVIAPVAFVRKRRTSDKTIPAWRYLKIGILCGAVMFAAISLQQFGLLYTSAGKSGFITSLYMVLVPLLAWVLFRNKIPKSMMAVVALAMTGVFLLCVNEQFTVNAGDILTLVCAVFLALHILLLAHYGKELDSLKLSLVQFLCCAIFSAIPMIWLEQPTWSNIAAAGTPILYCGILSVGFGYTAQTYCLKYVNTTAAALVMSTESVFSAIFGYFFLTEWLSVRQLAGCILVFLAAVTSVLLPKMLAKLHALHLTKKRAAL